MASYLELNNLGNDANLRNRVEFAVLVAAQTVLVTPASTDEQVGFAQRVIANPEVWAQRVLWLVLAANKDATVVQITTTVTDGQIQAAVNSMLAALAKGAVLGA